MSNELTPARRARREEPNLVEVIDKVFDRVDPLIKLIESLSNQSLRTREAEGRFKTRMAWFAAIIVGLVVGTSAFLTYVGKMDGSTFGFLLGLVVGYILSFIRDAIYPPKPQ